MFKVLPQLLHLPAWRARGRRLYSSLQEQASFLPGLFFLSFSYRIRHDFPPYCTARFVLYERKYAASLIFFLSFFFYKKCVKYLSCEFAHFKGRYSSLQAAWYSGRAFLQTSFFLKICSSSKCGRGEQDSFINGDFRPCSFCALTKSNPYGEGQKLKLTYPSGISSHESTASCNLY